MSTDDVWSVPDTQGTTATPNPSSNPSPSPNPNPNPPPAAVYPAYPLMQARPPEPYLWAWLTAGVLLLIAGVLQAAALLANSDEGTFVERSYYIVGLDISDGARAASMLACGVLLLFRRTRELGSGLTVGFGLLFAVDYFWQLRPSHLKAQGEGFAQGLFVIAFALAGTAALIVLIVLLRQRERVGERRTRAGRRADRLVAVVLGFLGAVLWIIVTAVTIVRLGVRTTSGSIDQVSSCCSWPQDDGWKQLAIVLGGALVIVLAMAAATLRSKIRAAGLLLGMVMSGLPDVLSQVASQIAPMPTFYGIHYRQFVNPFTSIVVTAAGGFWLSLVALLLLVGAAVSRLLLGPRKAAYPQNELERIAT